MTDAITAGEPFSIPGVPRGFVWPSGLVRRLEGEASRRLMLVAAPAGSGKTAVLAAIAHSTQADVVSWLRVTPAMDDPRTFAAALVGSVRYAATNWNGDRAATPPENVGASIARALGPDRHIVIFLDGYERIRHPEVHSLVERLMEDAGPNWRFRIGSRTTPPLPIARWRSQMRAMEIRSDELRIGRAGIARVLRDVYGLELRDESAAQLAERTDGWVTGLLLAGRQAQVARDVDLALSSFSGTQAPVVDYVAREITAPLDADVRTLVLETAGLIRLCADLSAVATRRPAAPRAFHRLTNRETFLRPISDAPGWYEHLPMLQDAFGALASPSPDAELAMYRRASKWCLVHGHVGEALEYMIRGGPDDVADAIAVLSAPGSLVSDECSPNQILHWIDRIPSALIEGRPGLRLVAIRSALESGDLDAAADHLSVLEDESGGVDDLAGPATGWLANRLDHLIHLGNVEEAMEQVKRFAHQLAEALAGDDAEMSAHLALSAARVYWLAGATSEAADLLASIRRTQPSVDTAIELHGLAALLALHQGDTFTAQSNIDRALPLAGHSSTKVIARRAAYLGLAALWTVRTTAPSWVSDCAQPTVECFPGDVLCTKALMRAELAWRSGLPREADIALTESSAIARRFSRPTILEELVRIQTERFAETPLGPVQMSGAQRAVLELLANDLTNAELAERLFVSRNTVKTHLRAIYRELGVESRSEAVAKALQLGLLETEDAPRRDPPHRSDADVWGGRTPPE